MKTASVSETLNALRCGAVRLEDHITATCDQIERKDGAIQSFLPEPGRRQRLLREASRQIDKKSAPLYGILIGVKDLFRVDSLPTQAGSRIPPEEFSGPQSELVTALKKAGALVLGKTVSTEFAYFNPGPTQNPRYPGFTPGGSSSGSAAAVAAGFCPLALGTQTIASVIRPAAFCGIVGFKPSSERLSCAGVFPFAQSVDTVGLFANYQEDIRIAMEALCPDWIKGLSGSGELLFAQPDNEFLAQAEPDISASFETLINKLTGWGVKIISTSVLSDIKVINSQHQKIIAYEFARNHQSLYTKYRQFYSAESENLYRQGMMVQRSDYQEALAEMNIFRNWITQFMKREGIAAWLSPATVSYPLKGLSVTGSPLMSLPWTFGGMPSCTLPAGVNRLGLPFGLQITTAPGEDEILFYQVIPLLQQFLDQRTPLQGIS